MIKFFDKIFKNNPLKKLHQNSHRHEISHNKAEKLFNFLSNSISSSPSLINNSSSSSFQTASFLINLREHQQHDEKQRWGHKNDKQRRQHYEISSLNEAPHFISIVHRFCTGKYNFYVSLRCQWGAAMVWVEKESQRCEPWRIISTKILNFYARSFVLLAWWNEITREQFWMLFFYRNIKI